MLHNTGVKAGETFQPFHPGARHFAQKETQKINGFCAKCHLYFFRNVVYYNCSKGEGKTSKRKKDKKNS